VPFLGQGVNCGFEDCRLLSELLDNESIRNEVLFENFYKKRKPDIAAIAEMSFQNYDEMRLRNRTQNFTVFYNIERELMNLYPKKYVPKYILISYMHYPYSFIQKIGKLQEALINNIYSRAMFDNIINWKIARKLVEEYFGCANDIYRSLGQEYS